jgi:hypothetical protein
MKNINRKKILLLTYAFSPLQAPESFLAIKALSKMDRYTVDVLTLNYDNLGLNEDDSLAEYVRENYGQIYRVQPFSWLNKTSFYWLRFVFFFPDKFRIFNNLIFKKAISINVEDYSVIISWSQWHSIHLAALKIKNKFPNIPWIAHFSDPWSDNPFLASLVGYKASQYFLEKKVIRAADAINFTTHLSRLLVMKKYPKAWIDKTYVTGHSYDLSLYNEADSNKEDTLVIGYFGNFYGPRNPIRLIQAINKINAGDNTFLKGVVFEFTGRWIGNENWVSSEFDFPASLIRIKSPVSYIESLVQMKRADLLLIVDAPFTVSIFFPSKLVDYIGAKKPILAITPEGSCAEILREVGGLVASPSSVEAIELGLVNAVNVLRDKSFNASVSGQSDDQFSNYFIASQFEIMIDQLVET